MTMEVPLMEKGILIGFTLFLSCLVFLLPLERKDKVQFRLIISMVVGIVLGVLLEKLQWTDWQIIPVLFCFYLYSTGVFAFCAKTGKREAWYYGVWGILPQQFLLQLGFFLSELLFGEKFMPVHGVITLLIVGIGLVVLGFTIARWLPEDGHYRVGPRQLTLAILMLMLYEVVFYGLSHTGYLVFQLFTQFYCISMLYFQSALFKKSELRQERDTIQILLRQQQAQYQVSKETIEIINQKCHDLKHQVRAIRTMNDDKERENYLDEVENSVDIYSAIVKTGNEILDIILTEKSLLCEKVGIHINCVADGKLLNFMDSTDLYSLFGNALDNAIESVRNIASKDKRMIDLMIYQKQKIMMIQIINPYEGALEFENGLPQTTKVNNGYHGFGLKSMRHTVEKYDGFLQVEGHDGCFYLQMMIPLPNK